MYADTVHTTGTARLASLTRSHVDNFDGYVHGDTWTALTADAGTSVTKNVPNGIVLTAGPSANDDEVAAYTTAFIMPGSTAGLRTTEVTTSVRWPDVSTPPDLLANFFIGFSSSFAANMTTDTGGAVPASPAVNTDRSLVGLYFGLLSPESSQSPACYFVARASTVTYALQRLYLPTAIPTDFDGKTQHFRLTAQVEYGSSVFVTPEFSVDGNAFTPLRALDGPLGTAAFYRSPNVAAAISSSGMRFGYYMKTIDDATEYSWFVNYAAWQVRR